MPDDRRRVFAWSNEPRVECPVFLSFVSKTDLNRMRTPPGQLVAEKASGADPEDPDKYRAVSIFWVPPEAR